MIGWGQKGEGITEDKGTKRKSSAESVLTDHVTHGYGLVTSL